ncbi:MAG TPA: hypothetical protein VMK42_17725 [Anaeromyxobacteraceae bacterium]|nr:hypothetical protein [Anaeromyxobacteraceae bacterium]
MEELTHLEQAVLRMFLAGRHPVLAALRAQLPSLSVARREGTGQRFETRFAVGRSARPAALPARVLLDDVHASVPGLAHGASFALFVVGGRLARLEGVTFRGEVWPKEIGAFTLHYDEPERDLSDLDAR